MERSSRGVWALGQRSRAHAFSSNSMVRQSSSTAIQPWPDGSTRTTRPAAPIQSPNFGSAEPFSQSPSMLDQSALVPFRSKERQETWPSRMAAALSPDTLPGVAL